MRSAVFRVPAETRRFALTWPNSGGVRRSDLVSGRAISLSDITRDENSASAFGNQNRGLANYSSAIGPCSYFFNAGRAAHNRFCLIAAAS